MDTQFKKLLEQSFTIRLLEHHLRILKEYLDHKLFTDQKTDLGLSPEDQDWLSSLGEEFLGQFNKDNLDQTMIALRKEVEALKVLTVYIPFNLPYPEVLKMGNYLRLQFNQNFVFETKYDPSLIGGCALVWNGIYKDYSLKAKIEANKPQIIANLKSHFK